MLDTEAESSMGEGLTQMSASIETGTEIAIWTQYSGAGDVGRSQGNLHNRRESFWKETGSR